MISLKKLFGTTFCAVFLLLLLQTNVSCKYNKKIRISPEGGQVIGNKQSQQLIDEFQKIYKAPQYPLVSVVHIDTIKKLLQNAANLRIYYGKNPNDTTLNLVLVAADNEGVDSITGNSCIVITKAGVTLLPLSTAARYTHQFQKESQEKYSDFPYAEKFNTSLIRSKLLSVPGIKKLRIVLGKDVSGRMGGKKVRIILFAADNAGERLLLKSATTGKIRSANPTYRLASYLYFDESVGLENGQECRDQCNIGSSKLY
ncbi:MAG: hypothetical protein EOP42_18525 [Sphingobacteriaceae bacterium]|nr:MAG: hypothetical protein EOP42_18525 [Sphingobacteriaceae bacterium]